VKDTEFFSLLVLFHQCTSSCWSSPFATSLPTSKVDKGRLLSDHDIFHAFPLKIVFLKESVQLSNLTRSMNLQFHHRFELLKSSSSLNVRLETIFTKLWEIFT